jgi:pyridoxal phosphate enzyme (YggS family)
MTDVAANYRKVMDTIHSTAVRCGRSPGEIKLLAASKSQDISAIRHAIGAGCRLFGENYVQEARGKREAIDDNVEWHLIGHLQRNKVKAALDLFSVIQSLDSLELALALETEGKKRGRPARVFVEVNLAGERTKRGITRDGLAPLLEAVGRLSSVRVEGLMTIPPLHEDVEKVRPYFRGLKELQGSLLRLRIPNVELRELSMGMSGDYVVAIEEGATLVRIGTAIFGARKG